MKCVWNGQHDCGKGALFANGKIFKPGDVVDIDRDKQRQNIKAGLKQAGKDAPLSKGEDLPKAIPSNKDK